MTEADKQLYKVASSGMCKRALQLDDTAKASIIGALGGAGIGALSHAITPKDEDEDKRERLIKNMLYGAAMGGLAGYGSKKFYDMSKPKVVKDSWAERNLDPSLGTALGATSLVSGGIGANKLLKKLFVTKGGDAADPFLQGGKFFAKPSDLIDSLKLDPKGSQAREIRNLYTQYDKVMSNPVSRFLDSVNTFTGGRLVKKVPSIKIPKVSIRGKTLFSGKNIDLVSMIRNQRNADVAFSEALHRARHAVGGPAGGHFDSAAAREATRGIKSLWSNPRKIVQAARSHRGAVKAFGVSGAALLAALLAKSVSKDRQQ